MSITSKNGFRSLIIVSFISGFGGVLDRVFPSLLSPELQEYFNSAQVTNYGIILAAISLVLILLSLIALIGVLMFRRWGRTLYVSVTALGIALLPLFNEQISSGIAAAFSTFSTISAGMAIALMFVDPVKANFESMAG
jgi:hypothetical protein